MGGALSWEMTFHGRLPFMEDVLWWWDNLRWKMTIAERWLLMEDKLWWKTTFDSRWPFMEDRQMDRYVGRQLTGSWQASGQWGWQEGKQVGWPGRCITLLPAVRRYGFWVKAQLCCLHKVWKYFFQVLLHLLAGLSQDWKCLNSFMLNSIVSLMQKQNWILSNKKLFDHKLQEFARIYDCLFAFKDWKW